MVRRKGAVDGAVDDDMAARQFFEHETQRFARRLTALLQQVVTTAAAQPSS
jgi:hypothetical protein